MQQSSNATNKAPGMVEDRKAIYQERNDNETVTHTVSQRNDDEYVPRR
jgi:hypothetical protein